MSIPPSSSPRSGVNHLLARLPAAEQQRLLRLMKPVSLDLGQVLYEYRAPIDYVYFLTRGTASALTVMDDGSAIEVATVGNEGVVGLNVLLASSLSPHKLIIQIGGEGLRMDAAELQQEAGSDGAFRQLLFKYHAAFFAQVSQSVACNGLHPVQQRCCRWLLMTHDRMDSDDIPLTHEFLGIMLGVRRSSVTEVLKSLHDRGLIKNDRGLITILDRQKMEATACECYARVKAEFERLFSSAS